jgi:hypothetical protein
MKKFTGECKMDQAKKLRVLYITLSPIDTNTSATLRNKAVLKGLAENGVAIDLLTLSAIENNNFFDRKVDKLDNVNIIRLAQNKAYSSLTKTNKSFIGRVKKILMPLARKVFHTFSLYDNTIYRARKLRKADVPRDYYDLVISSSDPKSSHIAAQKLISDGLGYGKWIQYWGDPMTDDITKKSFHPRWYVKRTEKRILSKADSIIYVSPFTLGRQEEMFPAYSHKMEFIVTPYMQPKIYEKDRVSSEGITIGYFGDYKSRVRDIGPIYRYAEKSNIRLVIAGNSDLELLPKENIIIYPRISQDEVSRLEEEADVLLCILNKHGTQIPGKLYHYAATNKPILVLLDGEHKGEMADYIKAFDRYIICDNNEIEIDKAINRIIQQKEEWSPSQYFSPELVGRKFLIKADNHSWNWRSI